MNPVHIHLILNHVSILAAIFSVILLIVSFFRNNATVRSIALYGFVLAALTVVPVFLTGEPAEESVEGIAGIAEVTIEAHEESAEISTWLIVALGVVSLGALTVGRKLIESTRTITLSILVLSFIASASIAYTGYLGGQIRHTELGTTGTNAPAQNGITAPENDGDDD